jgi:hypothetical protein
VNLHSPGTDDISTISKKKISSVMESKPSATLTYNLLSKRIATNQCKTQVRRMKNVQVQGFPCKIHVRKKKFTEMQVELALTSSW